MKKIILTTVAIFAFGFANAQDGSFKVGAHVGLPTGDIKDFSSINIGADVSYNWKLAESFEAGILAGYTSYLGKDGADAVGFVPIAATAKYNLNTDWFLGADLGYAIGASDNNDGGFLYQPKFGYNGDTFEVYASYKGISVDGGTFSSVNVGVNFKL